MIDCLPNATQTACVVCGWRWARAQRFPRRSCSKAPENLAARRKLLEKQLADFHVRCTNENLQFRPLEEAMEIIEKDCSACEHFTGDNCRELTGCREREKWAMYGVSGGYLPRLLGLAKPCERMIDGPR